MNEEKLLRTGSQREAFLHGEGDRYFERNDCSDLGQQACRTLDVMLGFLRPQHQILEIGCGDGRNLNYLQERCDGLTCSGLDPSQAAIEAGSVRYPKLRMNVGSADRLPCEDQSIDMVCFGFCLYLIDRHLLFSAIAEADRVLRDRGMLSIVDFDPPHPRKRSYRHLKGVYTFKANYADVFLSTGHYQLANKSSYSHSGLSFDTDPAQRVGHWMLYKDIDAAYGIESDSL